MPPGIGDIHWVLLKLRDWLRKRGADTAKAYVLEFDRRPRSIEFLQRIPFLKVGGYEVANPKTLGPEFDASYHHGTVDVSPRYRGYDAYFCFNGSLLNGKSMAEILPDCAGEWDYPILELDGDRRFGEDFAKQHGKYILLFFSLFGAFGHWAKHMPMERLRRLLKLLAEEFPGHRLVLTGSPWDLQISRDLDGMVVNMIGRTLLGQFLSLIRGASAFVGYPGGNTIISSHLRTPTLMIWGDFYKHPKFRTNWVRPSDVDKAYGTLEVETMTDGDVVKSLAARMRWDKRG